MVLGIIEIWRVGIVLGKNNMNNKNNEKKLALR